MLHSLGLGNGPDFAMSPHGSNLVSSSKESATNLTGKSNPPSPGTEGSISALSASESAFPDIAAIGAKSWRKPADVQGPVGDS
jgi:hypothetical protein